MRSGDALIRVMRCVASYSCGRMATCEGSPPRVEKLIRLHSHRSHPQGGTCSPAGFDKQAFEASGF